MVTAQKLTWAISSIALMEGNAFGQDSHYTLASDREHASIQAQVFSASQNYGVRLVSSGATSHLIVEAYFCSARNTDQERFILEESLKFWNKLSGKFAYQVSDGDGKKRTLPVYFELTEAPGFYTQEGFFMPAGHINPLGLVYLEILPDKKMEILDRKNTSSHAVGYTSDQAIFISESYADKPEIGIHEIGHILGAFHTDHSVMDPNLLLVNPKVKKKTIGQILSQAGIPLKSRLNKTQPLALNSAFPCPFAKAKVVKSKEKLSSQFWVWQNPQVLQGK